MRAAGKWCMIFVGAFLYGVVVIYVVSAWAYAFGELVPTKNTLNLLYIVCSCDLNDLAADFGQQEIKNLFRQDRTGIGTKVVACVFNLVFITGRVFFAKAEETPQDHDLNRCRNCNG